MACVIPYTEGLSLQEKEHFLQIYRFSSDALNEISFRFMTPVWLNAFAESFGVLDENDRAARTFCVNRVSATCRLMLAVLTDERFNVVALCKVRVKEGCDELGRMEVDERMSRDASADTFKYEEDLVRKISSRRSFGMKKFKMEFFNRYFELPLISGNHLSRMEFFLHLLSHFAAGAFDSGRDCDCSSNVMKYYGVSNRNDRDPIVTTKYAENIARFVMHFGVTGVPDVRKKTAARFI